MTSRRWMLVLIGSTSALALAACLGCSGPSANGLKCSDQGRCPSGFACYQVASESRCYDHPPDAGVAITTPDSDGGDSGAACPHLFCEDFESGLAPERWGVTNFFSTVALDDTRPYSGSRSLHVLIREPRNDPSYDPAHPVPAQGEIAHEIGPQSDYFIRFLVYAPPLSGEQQVRIAAVEANHFDDYPDISLWLNGGHPDVTFPDYSSVVSNTPVPANRWSCVEWEVRVGNPVEVRVWLGGVPAEALAPVVGDTSLVGTVAGQPVDQLVVVGAAVFGGAHPAFTTHEVWFDDIVVDTRPIGCPN